MANIDIITIHVISTNAQTNRSPFQIAISLHATGLELKKMLIPLVKLTPEQMKILFSGRILKDDQTLKDQQFRDKIKVVVMKQITEEEKIAFQKKEEIALKLDSVLKAAERVASRTEHDFRYTVEIRNQKGQKIHLPFKDRKTLILGMILHEKGRKCLNEKQLKQALEYFLQADKGFNECDPQYLELIDNYGYLNLDIAWTYYQLQDLEYLKEASWRLIKAEECFKRSHGEHQERLIALKGGACPDLVIYVRLYLLKAIVAFHSQSFQVAREFLTKAEDKLSAMNVTPEETLPLLQMGFTPRECKLAMRATGKSIEAAAQYILRMREKNEEEKKLREEKQRQKRLGKTVGGNRVDLQMYKRLKEMGFGEEMVAEGLRQTDNNEEKTLELLLHQPELLQKELQNNILYIPKLEDIQKLASMGFTEEMARRTLKRSRGDINEALTILLSGKLVPEILDSDSDNVQKNVPSSNVNNIETEDKTPSIDDEETIKKRQLEKKAEEELINDVTTDEETYLDINLDEETQILKLYKEYLEKATM